MFSLKKKNDSGFTIVELLIVIVVIGILALLVITTYSGIQQKARNAKRQTDLQSVQTQLEAYYQSAGHYPSLTDMNSGAFLTASMKSLDQNALVDPSNPTQSKTLLSTLTTATTRQYAYQVGSTSLSTSCEADDTTCALYSLSANYEGTVNGATVYTKGNLD